MKDRRFNILLNLIEDFKCKNIAEIGVARGFDSRVVIAHAKLDNFYLIDPDTQQVFEYENVFRGFLNAKFIRLFSNKAVKLFDDGELDMVYIDANHGYEEVTEDITLWLPKVKKGGIIAGHDYLEIGGVKKAVDELIGTVNLDQDIDSPTPMFIWWKQV